MKVQSMDVWPIKPVLAPLAVPVLKVAPLDDVWRLGPGKVWRMVATAEVWGTAQQGIDPPAVARLKNLMARLYLEQVRVAMHDAIRTGTGIVRLDPQALVREPAERIEVRDGWEWRIVVRPNGTRIEKRLGRYEPPEVDCYV